MRKDSPMSGQYAELWQQITLAEREELYASPERMEWILDTYDPDAERGRPILFFPEDQRSASRTVKIREMDAEPARDLDEGSWRKTFEFEGAPVDTDVADAMPGEAALVAD
jgi:hypothetical protein